MIHDYLRSFDDLEPVLWRLSEKVSRRLKAAGLAGRSVTLKLKDKEFRLVTRTAQNNDTQRWVLTPVGEVCNIQQRSNDRFVDAFEVSSEDFAVVTQTPQADLSQSWVFLLSGTDTYTIRQLSSRRFVDAYEDSGHDFAVVTRTAKNSDVQRWVIKPL